MARLEQPPSRLARGHLPQHVLVVLRGQLQHRQRALAEVGLVLLLRAELLQLDTRPLRQQLQRPALVGLLDQLDEREDIALPLAAEAVPRLTLRVDVEARAVLLVEGAQAPVILVPLREAHVLLDDLDQVDLGLDLREGVVGRQGGHGHYCAVRREAVLALTDQRQGGGRQHRSDHEESDRKHGSQPLGPGQWPFRFIVAEDQA